MVNDGSSKPLTEGLENIQRALPTALWISYTDNMGKGYALRKGVEASEADYLIYTDHDIPYTSESMLECLERMHLEGEEIIIGHRDASYYRDLPWFRVKVSHYLKTINSFILRIGTDDTQCGLKGFQKSIKPIFLATKTDRFLIDIEFLRRLKRKRKEVIIVDVKSRDNVQMSTLPIKTIFSELWAYIKIVIST